MTAPQQSRRPHICSMRVDPTSYDAAVRWVTASAMSGLGGYVCVATTHMVMEAFDQPAYRNIVNSADLVTPDGVPLVWALRMLGHRGAERVYGPDLTLRALEDAERHGIRVGFYGGTEETLALLNRELRFRFPLLQVVYSFSPPFRPLTAEEDDAVVLAIRQSGAQVLFVGIGCPKQERFMAEHRSRVPAVMLGVGAAFDFLSGKKVQAPRWMMSAGLEWLFRLLTEPKRLWRRYLKQNPRFIMHFTHQLLTGRQRGENA